MLPLGTPLTPGMDEIRIHDVSDQRSIDTQDRIDVDLDRDDQSLLLRRVLLRLKFLAFLTLAFSLFPLGVGTGTILYSVSNLPGYLLAALVTGIVCLLQSLVIILLVSEGWNIASGSHKSCLFRCLIKVLLVTTLCTLLTLVTYIAISGILGIVECSINSLHRCGPHRNFLICLSMTNFVTGCVLLILLINMSNIVFRKFVKIGLTSVSKTGQVYVRLNHIAAPSFTADI